MRVRFFLATCLHALLLLATVSAFFSLIRVSYAVTINVPGDHPTIQEAIDAAIAGDTISVSRRAGESQSVYYERLRVNKQLTLVGEGSENVLIDGSGGGTVIRIQADYVEIRGFTVRNGGTYSGIRADGYSYATIFNNTVAANKNGILFTDSNYNTAVQNALFNNSAVGIRPYYSVGNNISRNIVAESAYGIRLSYANATFVVGNTVSASSYGIYLEHSSNDTVGQNTLLSNEVDNILLYTCSDIVVRNNDASEGAYGIQLQMSVTNTILGNDVTNSSYGIYLAYASSSNIIENNTVSRNRWGITLYDSSSNTFKGNKLTYNTYGVDPVFQANNNLFHHNNYVANVEQVVWNPDCVNTWDNGAEGNYWSDYTGTDSNGDGIGDTPYVIDPMNRDRYPLMEPWGSVHDVAITDLTVSDAKAYVGDVVNITVTVENQGMWAETFNVTVSYENTTVPVSGTIETQPVNDLASGTSVVLAYYWNTSTAQPCVNYTIKAEASSVPGETDTTDNTYTGGTVKVNIVGDVNGDGQVDILDLTFVSASYGTFEGEPGYDPEADLTKDGLVDIRDIAIVAKHYGNTC